MLLHKEEIFVEFHLGEGCFEVFAWLEIVHDR